MNARLLRRTLLTLLAAALALGCAREVPAPPLAGAAMGGPFTLTSDRGVRVGSDSFNGRYRLVYFGFTHCPDVCPTDLQLLAAGLRQFEESDPGRAARVQPIFITTDPERDTPEVLNRFVDGFHPRLIGLTGSEGEIAEVARSHGVFYARDGGREGKDYLVNHSRAAILYGPAGEPIAIIPHDEGPGAVAAELGRWVQ